MRNAREGVCLWAAVLPACPTQCRTQLATPKKQLKRPIQIDQMLQPLGEHPVGGQVHLSPGTLPFDETDVSLLGVGPLVKLSRVLRTTKAIAYSLHV